MSAQALAAVVAGVLWFVPDIIGMAAYGYWAATPGRRRTAPLDT